VSNIFPESTFMSSVLPTENRVIRLLVADSTRMSAQLLADALQGNGVLEIVGTCTTAEEVLAAVGSHNPDVAIISACMHEQPLKGFDVVRQMRARHPGSKAIMLLDSSKRDLILASFGAGARGVFCRSESIASLRKCILSVHAGQVWASSREVRFALEALSSAPTIRAINAGGLNLLSRRELEVVHYLAEGLTNREIGARLGLSRHTIKNYLLKIFDKLGVSNRVELLFLTLSQPTAGVHAVEEVKGR